jgi:hypothetical protein
MTLSRCRAVSWYAGGEGGEGGAVDRRGKPSSLCSTASAQPEREWFLLRKQRTFSAAQLKRLALRAPLLLANRRATTWPAGSRQQSSGQRTRCVAQRAAGRERKRRCWRLASGTAIRGPRQCCRSGGSLDSRNCGREIPHATVLLLLALGNAATTLPNWPSAWKTCATHSASTHDVAVTILIAIIWLSSIWPALTEPWPILRCLQHDSCEF